jgi:hypothetical protein
MEKYKGTMIEKTRAQPTGDFSLRQGKKPQGILSYSEHF